MKKWRQIIQSFLSRHIVAPEPVITVAAPKAFTPGQKVHRFAVWQSLKAAKHEEPFFLSYSTDHPTIMEELRLEGWTVELLVDADGKLGYAISVESPNTFS